MLIDPMLHRLRAARGLDHMLQVALQDVVALHGAERGNLQLVNDHGQLVIVAQSGLTQAFLKCFENVEPNTGTICARAARERKTVLVPDVEQDAAFAPYLSIARSVPFRSVLSSPLLTAQGECIGIASVHFANRFTPTSLEVSSLEAYCLALARALIQLHPPGELRMLAQERASELMAAH
jgi:GAF domain-containing protein